MIDHSGILEGFKGKTYGKILLKNAVYFTCEQGVKITPLCPFAKAQLDKNEDLADVLY
ncbi:GNAT family N-acetyltransferase [Leeuwenhoekiella sp. UBA4164]|uniref:GNAT family N-acetyltransferase n=1 Tax=Leeuwenhoekiella sp. UBA4164 TaxID=1946746 RepID=UPI000C3B997A|nr:hypothetical protein [Leeuwenhoekiella sp.]